IAFLVLRRRGVYFSLLTLAFSALTYAIAFRWTAVTGGENGLGGVTRTSWFGVDLENGWVYYALVTAIGLAIVFALARFHRSPIGTVLVAIRENEQRGQFVGYATRRYKQVAYTLSAVLTGFAGVLSGAAIGQGDAVYACLRRGQHDGGVVVDARVPARSCGGIKAVVDASITVRVRSLHALIGPNGAGKTTIFNLISGLFEPDR